MSHQSRFDTFPARGHNGHILRIDQRTMEPNPQFRGTHYSNPPLAPIPRSRNSVKNRDKSSRERAGERTQVDRTKQGQRCPLGERGDIVAPAFRGGGGFAIHTDWPKGRRASPGGHTSSSHQNESRCSDSGDAAVDQPNQLVRRIGNGFVMGHHDDRQRLLALQS